VRVAVVAALDGLVEHGHLVAPVELGGGLALLEERAGHIFHTLGEQVGARRKVVKKLGDDATGAGPVAAVAAVDKKRPPHTFGRR
jgi:hypothetical protein